MTPSTPAASYGALQRLVDELFEHEPKGYEVSRIDVLMRAEIDDLEDDLLEVVELLPPAPLNRQNLCDQINSVVTAHGWGNVYGTVE